MEKSQLQELWEIVERLRGPQGCPWDMEQTHHSIRDCLVEEVSELLEALDNEDAEHICEELGDVLLHVMFHASIAKDAGKFDIEEVAKKINEKLVRRHPHVFGETQVEGMDQLWEQWESIKGKEKKNGKQSEGVFKHLPPSLPALLYAKSVHKQLKKLGKAPEVGDLDDEEQMGQEIFELVKKSKDLGIDPESALRRYTNRLVLEAESNLAKG